MTDNSWRGPRLVRFLVVGVLLSACTTAAPTAPTPAPTAAPGPHPPARAGRQAGGGPESGYRSRGGRRRV